MNNCTEYLALISAYVDGELSESDELLLSGHLDKCAYCSSALKAYRGISTTICEECVPAPPSLCPNVMEKIANVDTDKVAANLKTYNTVNKVMTRYLPMAACLAFLILTAVLLPGIIGNRNKSANDYEVSMQMAVPDRGNEEADMESESATDFDTAPRESNFAQGAGGYSPMSPNADPADISEDHDGYNSNKSDDRTFTQPMPDESMQNEPAPGEPLSNDESADIPGDDFAPIENDAPPSSYEIEEEYIGLYAIIIVSGEMPEILKKYDPVYPAVGGQMHYEIPRDAAEILIEEIKGQGGASIEYYDIESGAYALVYYTP